jgi:hypothetical protein
MTDATILLVDDNAAFREVTAEALSSLGYTVDASGSRDEVLASAARNAAAQLLITDIVMGKTNGVDLAAEVRLVRPDIRVLYCSGYPRATLVQRGLKIDENEFLRKPLSLRALAPKVAELLGS